MGYELAPLGYTGPDQYHELLAGFYKKAGFTVSGDGNLAMKIIEPKHIIVILIGVQHFTEGLYADFASTEESSREADYVQDPDRGRRPGNGAGHTERDEDVGNEAEYVQDFQNVLTVFTGYDPHLVLMDITLPFYNGYHWCSEIRKISGVRSCLSPRRPII